MRYEVHVGGICYLIMVMTVCLQLEVTAHVPKVFFHENPFKNTLKERNRDRRDSIASLYSTSTKMSSRCVNLHVGNCALDTAHILRDRTSEIFTNGKDSLEILRYRASNNFFTRNLFSLMIRSDQTEKNKMKVNSANYFQTYDGLKVGQIRVQRLDVFGPTFEDTLKAPYGWLERTGNAVHAFTKESKIRSQLLFNSGDRIDAQLFAENEKIIRDLPFIQDVSITLTCSPIDDQAADVTILVKDKFEYSVSGSINSTSNELEISNKNMFGIGHQITVRGGVDYNQSPTWGGSFSYMISDLGKQFINTGVTYTNDYRKLGYRGFIEKPFLSSVKGWAGGVDIERVVKDHYLTPYQSSYMNISASYFNTDCWFGYLFRPRNVYSRLGNITLSGRFLHQNYFNGVPADLANSYFRNHEFWMGTVGFSRRQLYRNNKVYGYGVTEDIPYGRYFEIGGGTDKDSQGLRTYFHLMYTKARILKGGAYFNWQAALGGFLGSQRINQGALHLNAFYFTDYVYLNRHPYRFFFYTDYLGGINRFQEEYLVINNKFGIRDFSSTLVRGNNRLRFNIEAVRFWGYHTTGFRFAHYFFADAAFLAKGFSTLLSDQFYTGLGMGIRIHNESLVFNVLELRLSWLPITTRAITPFAISGFGQPKGRFNDFLGRKPQEIVYQ